MCLVSSERLSDPARDVDLFGRVVVGPVPLDRELLAGALMARLTGSTAEQIVGMMYSPVEAIVDFARLCRGDSAGQKISLLFNPHRLDVATITGPSIAERFNDPSFLSGLARALAFKDGLYRDRDLLYQVLQLGINGASYVNEFPPYLASRIYSDFGATRILDPCAGWGGRMIGAAAIGAHYHGFEPSTRTHRGLLALGEFLRSFNNGFTYRVDCLPFEDAGDLERYDLALTSPPYFDTEHYADEPTQAAVRWPTFEKFCAGFFVPMIAKALAHSNNGLVLNIGSRRYPLSKVAEKTFPRTKRLSSFGLSGAGGLGKDGTEGETFLLIESTT